MGFVSCEPGWTAHMQSHPGGLQPHLAPGCWQVSSLRPMAWQGAATKPTRALLRSYCTTGKHVGAGSLRLAADHAWELVQR